MKNLLQQLKKYPLVPIFFAFLALYSAVDALAPTRERSELENRTLMQRPAFSAESFLNNEWTLNYADYVKDQLVLRDGWITAQSALETVQGKLENNGVWYAKDGYQIAQNSFLTDTAAQRLAINTTAVAELAGRYPGRVTAMVVPSPANTLSELLRYSPPQMDEDALLDDIFAQLAQNGASVVDLRDIYANREEQLFYRTDHHWTTTGGAYLAYTQLCAQLGLTPTLPNAPLVQIPDFYGTSYAKTKRIGTAPDTLEYYDIPNTLTVYSYNAAGELVAQDGGVMQYEKLDEYDKYAAFLRGNNGYSELAGSGEGRILVIKDSYGNCFVPFLAQHYETVGIIDLRAWQEIDSIIDEKGYDEILVLYCFESFSTDTNAYRMMTDVQHVD